MSNNIPVMGVLHSVTADGTVAVAEEIEITLPDKTKKKLSSEITSYVKAVTSEELARFISYANINNIKTDYLFICKSSTNDAYAVGHLYFYDGDIKQFIDITSSYANGNGNSSSNNIDYYVTNNNGVNFNWTSVNTGYGTVYLIVDGLIVDSKMMLQGSGSFNLLDYCGFGKHYVSLYVMDSANHKSSTETFDVTIGNYMLYSDFTPKDVYSIDDVIHIPYHYDIVTENDTLEYSVLYSIDGGDVYTVEDTGELIVSGLSAGFHTVNMQVQTTNLNTSEVLKTNKLTFTIPLVINGVVYAVTDEPEITLGSKSQKVVTVRVASTVVDKYMVTLEWYKNGVVQNDLTSRYTFNNGENYIIISNSNIGQYTLAFTIVGVKDGITYENELVNINLTIENEVNKNITPDTHYFAKYSAMGITNNDWQRDYLFGGKVCDLSYIDNGYENNILHLSDLGYVKIDNPLKTEPNNATYIFNIKPVFGKCVSSELEEVGLSINNKYATLSNNNSKISAFLNMGEMNHIAFVINKADGYMAIYVNGKLMSRGTVDKDIDIFANNLDNMIIGGESECYVQDIRFYDFAMNDESIVKDYCASPLLSSEKDTRYRKNGFADNMYSTLPSIQLSNDSVIINNFDDIKTIPAEIVNTGFGYEITLAEAYDIGNGIPQTHFIIDVDKNNPDIAFKLLKSNIITYQTYVSTPAKDELLSSRTAEYRVPYILYDENKNLVLCTISTGNSPEVFGITEYSTNSDVYGFSTTTNFEYTEDIPSNYTKIYGNDETVSEDIDVTAKVNFETTESGTVTAVIISDSIYNDMNGTYLNTGHGEYQSNKFTLTINDLDNTYDFTSDAKSFTLSSNITANDEQTVVFGKVPRDTALTASEVELQKLLRYLDEGDGKDLAKHIDIKSLELLVWMDLLLDAPQDMPINQEVSLVTFGDYSDTENPIDEDDARKYGTRLWYVFGTTANYGNKLKSKFVEYIGTYVSDWYNYLFDNYNKFRDIIFGKYSDILSTYDTLIPAVVYNKNIENAIDTVTISTNKRANLYDYVIDQDTRYKYEPEYSNIATFTPTVDTTLSFTIKTDENCYIYIDDERYDVNKELDIALNVKHNQQVVLHNAGHIIAFGDLSAARISELNVSNMILLEELYIRDSKLTTLDVSNNKRLRVLDISGSVGITNELDLSNNNYLETINTVDSTITYVHIKDNSNIKNIALSDQTKTIKLYGAKNVQSFSVTNYNNLSTVKTDNLYVSSVIINNWVPSKQLVNIDLGLDCDCSNTDFLDKCVELKQNNNATIKLAGILNVTTQKIPNKYSQYDTLGLSHISYPNITDLSGMFEEYKNIDKIVNGEIVSPYTEDDVLADIKRLLAPLKRNRISDISNMFRNCSILTRLDDDTFDGFTFTDECRNTAMFEGCTNLEYVKLPKVKNLDSNIIYGANYVVVYVPESVEYADDNAFKYIENSDGCHPVILFEDIESNIGYVQYVDDAKYNIAENMKTANIKLRNIVNSNTISNNNAVIKYFEYKGTNGKLVYSLSTPAYQKTLFVSYDTNTGYYSPDISSEYIEFLPGALAGFNDLQALCIPNICIRSISSTPLLKNYDLSLASLFNKKEKTTEDINLSGADKLFIYNQNNCDIQDFLLYNNKRVKSVTITGPVYSIGSYSFAESRIDTFVIENDSRLESIGTYAFNDTKLSMFSIPETVTTVGTYAFANNNFTYFRYTPTYIPMGCFSNCNETINGSFHFNKNIEYIGAGAFMNSNNLLYGADISELTKLQQISSNAFANCDNIKKILLTDKITEIGENAFYTENNTVTKLIWDLSDGYSYNVTIESGAFGFRNITSIIDGVSLPDTLLIPENVSLEDEIVDNVDLVLLKDTNKSMIADNATTYENMVLGFDRYYDEDGNSYLLLKDNKAIYHGMTTPKTSVVIPATVNGCDVIAIDNEAFIDNGDDLQSIVCNANITRVGKHIFEPDNIHNLQLPNTITYIGCGTDFKSTPWYRSLLLDDYVYIGTTCIGYSAYQTDINHTNKTIKTGTTDIYDYAFYNEHMLTINLPDTIVRLHQDSLAGNDFNTIDLKNVVIINDRALDECDYLTSITFPASVTHIGSSVISSLTKIEYEDGIILDSNSTLIRQGIKELKIPNSLRVWCDRNKEVFDDMTECTGLILGEYEQMGDTLVPSRTYTGAYFDISNIDGMSAVDIRRVADGFADDDNYHTLYCSAEQMATVRPYISDITNGRKISIILRQD